MRTRLVRPEIDTLTISHGDTLTVKKRLTTGEQRAAFKRAYTTVGETLVRQPLDSGMALVTAYLVDWSLTDAEGNRIEIARRPMAEVEAALDNLDYASFVEIKEAIEAHEAAQTLARAQEKKLPDGATNASPTL